jgi:hypothetical protein
MDKDAADAQNDRHAGGESDKERTCYAATGHQPLRSRSDVMWAT